MNYYGKSWRIARCFVVIDASTAVQPDANGDLLTKWLNDPLLNWDATVSLQNLLIF